MVFLFVLDDQWILTFLRCCKFSLQKTKEKIDAYYTIRNLMPEFFENRDPFEPEIQEYLKAGYANFVLLLVWSKWIFQITKIPAEQNFG